MILGEKSVHIIGQRIKSEMKENHISRGSLAEYMNVSESTISKWCNGQVVPNMESLRLLADRFGCDLVYLTGDIKERTVGLSLASDVFSLSENALNFIAKVGRKGENGKCDPLMETVNGLLERPDLIEAIHVLKNTDKVKEQEYLLKCHDLANHETLNRLATREDVVKLDSWRVCEELIKFCNSESSKNP